MAGKALSPEQIESLEKILGVKLPEGGFSVEITPHAVQLPDGQLDAVSGGIPGNPVRLQGSPIRVNVLGNNWSMKI